MIKINKNEAGFTLVELLAAMVILALLTAIAVPNVLKMLNKSRSETYINDAQRLISTAENQYKKDTKITKLKNNGECIIMGLSYLDNGTFDETPYGGSYDRARSYVLIKKENLNYVYYARLLEEIDDDGLRGVVIASSDQLVEKDAYSDYVTNKRMILIPDITDYDDQDVSSDQMLSIFRTKEISCDSLHVYAPKE